MLLTNKIAVKYLFVVRLILYITVPLSTILLVILIVVYCVIKKRR